MKKYLILALFIMAVLTTYTENIFTREESMLNEPQTIIPPIDLNKPVQLETATFALG